MVTASSPGNTAAEQLELAARSLGSNDLLVSCVGIPKLIGTPYRHMRPPHDQFYADFRWLSLQCDLLAGEAAQLFSHLNAEQADDISRAFVEGLGKV